jgi:DNA-binding transcriptional ArsR family regulator
MSDYPSPDMADVDLVTVLRALADPTRLQIAQSLADGEPHPKSELNLDFDCTKATMAHHFKTLRESGVTRTIVNGRTHDLQLRRVELDEKFPGLIASIVTP